MNCQNGFKKSLRWVLSAADVYVLHTVLHKYLTYFCLSCLHIFLPVSSSSCSFPNCSLPLQMYLILLRMSNAHQLARTLPQSYGTPLRMTAAFPLKVSLELSAAYVHSWCLSPGRKQPLRKLPVCVSPQHFEALFKRTMSCFNDFTKHWCLILQVT